MENNFSQLGIAEIERIMKKYPEAKSALNELKENLFEDVKVFCKVGAVLRSKKYYGSCYVVLQLNDNIVLYNSKSKKPFNHSIKCCNLADPKCETLTTKEFNSFLEGTGRTYKEFIPNSVDNLIDIIGISDKTVKDMITDLSGENKEKKIFIRTPFCDTYSEYEISHANLGDEEIIIVDLK